MWIEQGGKPNRASRGAPMAFARAALLAATDECIVWPYAVNPRGYGLLGVNGGAVGAHRWVCIQTHGQPLEDQEARHSCHVTGCINPAHLSWGTHTENMHDSIRAGRNAVGEKHTRSLLTDAIVSAIRQSQLPDTVWASRLNVNTMTVLCARTGKSWRHVPTPPRLNIRMDSIRYRDARRREASQ